MNRCCGMLMPIFSLPSKYGIGTFGKESYRFIDFLKKSGQSYWQMLPLNPTSYGDSPYQSFSAFALNPYFIDLEDLRTKGYISQEDLNSCIDAGQIIDYGKLYNERFKILLLAYQGAKKVLINSDLERFKRVNRFWLDDYALFMVIKGLNGGKSWDLWEDKYKYHDQITLEKLSITHQDEIEFWIFLQYILFKQYKKLRNYAKRKGIRIIGDIPIYVALDSSDVWSKYDLFMLDSYRQPKSVAGVPPDYFSPDGQLWGNPIYDYKKMEESGFSWWKKRIKHCSKLYDVCRIDHFRGFDEYYAIPYKEATAKNGMWLKGPGIKLIETLKKASPKMDFIAEDLGILTNTVKELKIKSGWPGMKILEFAFDSGYTNEYLPHNYEKNCVAYIGTHDNDTIANFLKENPNLHGFMKEYLRIDDDKDIIDTMIGSLLRSNADTVILTLQDLLHLGSDARINKPGTMSGNWCYRISEDMLSEELSMHLEKMVKESGRCR